MDEENNQFGMKRSGGDNVVEELATNAAATHQNHRNCLHFFFFFFFGTTFVAGCFCVSKAKQGKNWKLRIIFQLYSWPFRFSNNIIY